MLSFDENTLWSWKNGSFQDPEDGSPAIIEYYKNGQVKFTGHRRDGNAHDPADGSPAEIWYSETGEILGGYSSANGKLSPEQMAGMLKAAQVNRVAALLAKADQSIVPVGMPLANDCGVSGSGEFERWELTATAARCTSKHGH